jgi:two-component system cell cycle response regulator
MIVADDILNASILIVDDQEANVRLLEQMLREAGYSRITSTMDPHAVCALHRDNRYDLILLDLQMPGMDGFRVMEGLKENNTDGYLPVLVISAQPGHKLRALQAGAKDFVSKPFDLMEAKTRIHNMLEVRLLYKQVEHSSHEMQNLALHDALTGLPNRRLLMDRLTLSIAHARRSKREMVLMYLDLDGFKQVNDTMGHDAGDILLGMVAARLLAAVRQEAMVARLGGDEFVIALWELSHVGDVAKLASKVISAVAQPCIIQGRTVRMTASIGVGIYPMHGTEAGTLMKSADMAMYQAKLAGKNGYRIAATTDLLEMAHG